MQAYIFVLHVKSEAKFSHDVEIIFIDSFTDGKKTINISIYISYHLIQLVYLKIIRRCHVMYSMIKASFIGIITI